MSELDPERLEVVQRESSVIGVSPGTRVVERGSSDDWTFFLLEGAVVVLAADGKKQLITGDSPHARHPIARLQPRQYDVVATEPSKLIRVATRALEDEEAPAPIEGYGVSELTVEGDTRQAMLCLQILGDIEEDRLELPSLPEQALRVRQMIEEGDANAPTLARALAGDATMTAKLIRSANSALYSGAAPVGTCAQAIVRLGIQTTSQLIMTFALRELFEPESSVVKERMVALWEHSTSVAALCYALGRMASGFEPERAMLAGLLHDIGVTCVLSYADRQPDLAADEESIDASIEQLRGQLGGLILRSWNFPDEIVAAGESAEDWVRDASAGADYCDLVISAHLLELLSRDAALPVADLASVPALAKLFRREVTPEVGREILERAAPHVSEVQELLRG